MSYKRGLAIVFGCAIAGMVSFAATYPRFYSPTATPATSNAAAAGGASASSGESLLPLSGLSSSSSPLSWDRLTEAQHAALAPFAARPHWGKLHTRTAEQLAPLYPRWGEFQAARRAFDPQGMFSNDYLDQVLGVSE